jgi:16S rRNA (cytosine1402-N4)-methyltransferase
MDYEHIPVMTGEILSLLPPVREGIWADLTIGGGGTAEKILEVLGDRGMLLGVDRDPHALVAAGKRLKRFSNVRIVKGNFRDLDRILRDEEIGGVDVVVADLGVSSMQLDDPSRGFSFRADAPLAMTMDPQEMRTAAEFLRTVSRQDLERILREYGEERYAARVARALVREREKRPIETTGQLAGIVQRALPPGRAGRVHPATRTFMAVRIAVNDELEALRIGLEKAIEALMQGGRIIVLSYHSLEDRIVKRTFQAHAGKCQCPKYLPECRCAARQTLKLLTTRPITPSREEIDRNPRARSAKLRAAERIKEET